jgi:predicted enzyme related to lactoylglutathione lyase
MQKVTGIGGIFFKSKDPQGLNAWYEEHLGVSAPPTAYDDPDWQQQSGPTVFGPMPYDGEHFQKPAQLYINFRVEDLNAMCKQLEDAGITVAKDAEEYPNGRFASLEDPEGNQIQLWEVKK